MPYPQMKRYQGPVDVCIVGSGAGGSVLAKELAEAGASVVVLEAGEWVTREDMRNDELASFSLMNWDDLRIVDGQDPLTLGWPNTGRGVGGSTLHFTAVALRLHASDFRVRSQDGVAVDWPISYQDLDQYYRQVEHALGVSGPLHFPWGEFHGPYPMGALPPACRDQKIGRGMDRLGIRWVMAPHAIVTGDWDGRSACMNYGFCIHGCKSDAKSSMHVTYLPKAIAAGAEVRTGCMAFQVNLSPGGLARSVSYYDRDGREHQQEAALVCLCCYSVETPRLLLNSRSPLFPDGLANSSGLVGRNLMVHLGNNSYARFDDPVDAFVTPPVGLCSQDFYETSPAHDYVRGWTFESYFLFPISFATSLIYDYPDLWGQRMVELMKDYTHFAMLGIVGEVLPHPDHRVTLAQERDRFGIPVARVTFSRDDNARRMSQAADAKSRQILEAAGANLILPTHPFDHLLGTCRMGADPAQSVVNPWCRAHDVDNLYIVDGSVFPTAGAVNPSLTIMALATRTAAHLTERARRGELGLALVGRRSP